MTWPNTNFCHKTSVFFVRNILELKKYWSHKTLFFEFKPQTCTPKHQKQSLRIQLQINTQQLILIQVGKTQVCIVYTLKYSVLQSNKTQNMLLFCTNFKRKYHIHSWSLWCIIIIKTHSIIQWWKMSKNKTKAYK